MKFVRLSLLVLFATGFIASCENADHAPAEPFSIVTAERLNEIVASQKGNVVVLNLWATWCEPCRAEFPALVRLDEAYRDKGVTVIGLSADEPDVVESHVKPFIDEVGARFTILVKAYGDPMHFLNAVNTDLSGALPETIVYGRDGKVLTILAGEQTYESFEQTVNKAL